MLLDVLALAAERLVVQVVALHMRLVAVTTGAHGSDRLDEERNDGRALFRQHLLRLGVNLGALGVVEFGAGMLSVLIFPLVALWQRRATAARIATAFVEADQSGAEAADSAS